MAEAEAFEVVSEVEASEAHVGPAQASTRTVCDVTGVGTLSKFKRILFIILPIVLLMALFT